MAYPGDTFASTKTFEDEIAGIVKERGMQGLNEYVSNELEKWKDIEINIAVTGNSGAGKSAFINAIRGLQPSDQQAAAEDITECTQERTSYSHPRNPRFVLWDLPGVGTPARKKSTYVADMQFSIYDFFIVVCSKRFTEIDSDLVQTLQKLDKPFFFIRAHIDQDIANDRLRNLTNHDEAAVLKKIRDNCTHHLHEATNLHTKYVYLINNHCTRIYDFEKLQIDLLEAAPKEKRKSLILSMSHKSKNIIKEKCKTLKGRSLKVAIKATIAVTVPGADIVMDGNILLEEVQFYQQQLGLDETSMKKTSEKINMTLDKMRQMLNLKTKTFTVESIILFCESLITQSHLRTALLAKLFCDPAVAVMYVSSSFSSFWEAYNGLNDILLSMEEDALEISEVLEEHARGGSIL